MNIRLAVSLTAAALIGLSLCDVTFVIWAHGALREARRASLYTAAVQVQQPGAPFAEIAQAHGLLLQRGDTPELPALPDNGLTTLGQREYLVVQVPGVGRLVLSHPINDVLAPLYALHGRALAVLALCTLVMVAFGMVFLRRTILRPLKRLTRMVVSRDKDELVRFGPDQSDDLGRLSHAIIAMAHVLEEDRARIAAQLGELESAQAQLVRAERLVVVGRLSAGLAHEIGNPLAVLAGFVELLQDAALDAPSRASALERMGKELTRISKTVRQLLDFSRVPAPDRVAGDVGEALRTTQNLLAPQERLRGVTLTLPALTEPLRVGIDTDSLVQVLVNLWLNAADALQHQGEIAVHVVANAGHVQLDVEDSGPGVSAALRERIFEPFFTTKPAGVGTGLGLSVCERIVTSSGGDITVGPSSLGGARFRLTLPHGKVV